jgi:hypothetical protein
MKIILFIFFSLTLLSCNAYMPFDKKFYGNTKTGILILVDSIEFARSGSQGLLDYAVTPGGDYKTVIRNSKDKIFDIKNYIGDSLMEVFNSKQKKYILIKEKFKKNTFTKLQKGLGTGYYESNISVLKSSLDIDELLIIKLKNGLNVDYYGFIEIGKYTFSDINAKIIRVSDSYIMYENDFKVKNVLKTNLEKKEELNFFIDELEGSTKESISRVLNEFIKN